MASPFVWLCCAAPRERREKRCPLYRVLYLCVHKSAIWRVLVIFWVHFFFFFSGDCLLAAGRAPTQLPFPHPHILPFPSLSPSLAQLPPGGCLGQAPFFFLSYSTTSILSRRLGEGFWEAPLLASCLHFAQRLPYHPLFFPCLGQTPFFFLWEAAT